MSNVYRRIGNDNWELIGWTMLGTPVWCITDEIESVMEQSISATIEVVIPSDTLNILQLAFCDQIFVQHIPFDFGEGR